jgi:hypothetical protein
MTLEKKRGGVGNLAKAGRTYWVGVTSAVSGFVMVISRRQQTGGQYTGPGN